MADKNTKFIFDIEAIPDSAIKEIDKLEQRLNNLSNINIKNLKSEKITSEFSELNTTIPETIKTLRQYQRTVQELGRFTGSKNINQRELRKTIRDIDKEYKKVDSKVNDAVFKNVSSKLGQRNAEKWVGQKIQEKYATGRYTKKQEKFARAEAQKDLIREYTKNKAPYVAPSLWSKDTSGKTDIIKAETLAGRLKSERSSFLNWGTIGRSKGVMTYAQGSRYAASTENFLTKYQGISEEKAKAIREGKDTLPTSMSEVAPESERYTALAGIAKSEKDLEFTVELLKEANRIDEVVGKTAGKLNQAKQEIFSITDRLNQIDTIDSFSEGLTKRLKEIDKIGRKQAENNDIEGFETSLNKLIQIEQNLNSFDAKKKELKREISNILDGESKESYLSERKSIVDEKEGLLEDLRATIPAEHKNTLGELLNQEEGERKAYIKMLENEAADFAKASKKFRESIHILDSSFEEVKNEEFKMGKHQTETGKNVKVEADPHSLPGRLKGRATIISMMAIQRAVDTVTSEISKGKGVVAGQRPTSQRIGYNTGNYDFRGIRKDARNLGQPYGVKGSEVLNISEAILGTRGQTTKADLSKATEDTLKFSKFSGATSETAMAFTNALTTAGLNSDITNQIQEGAISAIKSSGMMGRQEEQIAATTAILDNANKSRNVTDEEITSKIGLFNIMAAMGNRAFQGKKGSENFASADSAIRGSSMYSDLGILMGVGSKTRYQGVEGAYNFEKDKEKGLTPEMLNTIVDNSLGMSTSQLAVLLKNELGLGDVEATKQLIDLVRENNSLTQDEIDKAVYGEGNVLGDNEKGWLGSSDKSREKILANEDKIQANLDENAISDTFSKISSGVSFAGSATFLTSFIGTALKGLFSGAKQGGTSLAGNQLAAYLSKFSLTNLGDFTSSFLKGKGVSGVTKEGAKATVSSVDDLISAGGKTAANTVDDIIASSGSSTLKSLAPNLGKIAGAAGLALGGIMGVKNVIQADPEDRGRVAGKEVGSLGGGAIGAAIGTAMIPIPVLGTLIGAGLGSALGGKAGEFAGSSFQNLFGTLGGMIPGLGGFGSAIGNSVGSLLDSNKMYEQSTSESSSYLTDQLISAEKDIANKSLEREKLRQANIEKEQALLSGNLPTIGSDGNGGSGGELFDGYNPIFSSGIANSTPQPPQVALSGAITPVTNRGSNINNNISVTVDTTGASNISENGIKQAAYSGTVNALAPFTREYERR